MKYTFFAILALLTLACSVSTATPATETTRAPAPTSALVVVEASKTATGSPTSDFRTVYALGTVNIRKCAKFEAPAKVCPVVGSVDIGAELASTGRPIMSDRRNCSAGWIPIIWKNSPAFVCGDWVSKSKLE